jgi:hypothetical protein
MDIIDRFLKYCPTCGDEYRVDFFLCAACGEELISGADVLLSKAEKTRDCKKENCEIGEGDTLFTIQKGSLLDMKRMKRLLGDAAVPALLLKEENCRNSCCGPQILLQIRQQDLERAMEVLQEEHLRTTAGADYQAELPVAVFEPNGSYVVCPACRHEFIPDGPDCPDCGLHFLE